MKISESESELKLFYVVVGLLFLLIISSIEKRFNIDGDLQMPFTIIWVIYINYLTKPKK